LELFARRAADLVITDMVLPGKGGLEIIRRLREKDPRLKIIAMSGGVPMGAEDNLRAARRSGAAQVLAKPFAFARLLRTIDGVLATSG
jgi:DNA-binding response OmpR family regulator